MARLNDGGPLHDEASLREALAACGCDAARIEQCAALAREGRLADEERLLARQRRALMEEVRAEQRKVDRLDYVLRAIERKGG